MSNRVQRCVHLVGVTSAPLRTASFEAREHLVVPVVMLVEGVVFAVNAEHPEFVPAEELRVAPAGWGGRPVTWTHPVVDGNRVMANSPSVLERFSVGKIFNPSIRDDVKLVAEAWLDVNGKSHIPEGRELVDRAKTGDPIEVSVGVFVTEEKTAGVFNGKPYKSIWRNIVPDHLAMLPKGDIGACSIAMGCGAPRAARSYFITASGYEPTAKEQTVNKCAKCNKEHEGECAKEDQTPARSLKDRLAALIRPRVGAETRISDTELANKLELSLRAVEPGFLGVDSVYFDDNEVVYAASPDPDQLQFFQRSYKLKDGNVTLSDERIEMEMVTRFEPKDKKAAKDKAAEASTKTACGCGGNGGKAPVASEGATDMKIDKERVNKLLARKTTSFTEADAAYLEGFTEERFKQLEAIETPEEKAAREKAEAEQAAAKAASSNTTLTPEQWLAAAPPELRALIERQKNTEAAERTAAIKVLTEAKAPFTETELAALPTETVKKLAATIKPTAAVDYSVAAGVVRAAEDNSNDAAPEPIDLTARIAERRQKQSA